MTVTDRDIWLVAAFYVEQYGDDAFARAQMHAGESLASGDSDGHAVCVLITDAIEALQQRERGGESLH